MARKNPAAVALGRRGGRKSTDATRRAAKQNAQRAGRPPRHVSADLWRMVHTRVEADGLTLDQVVPALYERFIREGL